MNEKVVLQKMEEAARFASEFIITEFDQFSTARIETKSKNNFVSFVDKEAERRIMKVLEGLFPTQVYMGEEYSPTAKLGEYTWIIDPLDGTTNFVHHFPLFTVSIALLHHQKLVAGLIYDPIRDEVFSTFAGGGAFLNGKSIKVTSTPHLSESLWAIGFPYHHEDKMTKYLQFVEYTIGNTHGVRRLGSAAADLAWVAAGRLDGFFEYGLSPWDVAAGALLVMEAGGVVSDFSNTEHFLFGKEIVADNGLLHTEFINAFGKFYFQ